MNVTDMSRWAWNTIRKKKDCKQTLIRFERWLPGLACPLALIVRRRERLLFSSSLKQPASFCPNKYIYISRRDIICQHESSFRFQLIVPQNGGYSHIDSIPPHDFYHSLQLAYSSVLPPTMKKKSVHHLIWVRCLRQRLDRDRCMKRESAVYSIYCLSNGNIHEDSSRFLFCLDSTERCFRQAGWQITEEFIINSFERTSSRSLRASVIPLACLVVWWVCQSSTMK